MQIGDLAKISTSSLAASNGTRTLAILVEVPWISHQTIHSLLLQPQTLWPPYRNQTVTLARWPQVTRDWADGPNTLAHKLLIPQQENSPREQIKEWMNCFTVWGTESWQIWQYFTTGLIFFFFYQGAAGIYSHIYCWQNFAPEQWKQKS